MIGKSPIIENLKSPPSSLRPSSLYCSLGIKPRRWRPSFPLAFKAENAPRTQRKEAARCQLLRCVWKNHAAVRHRRRGESLRVVAKMWSSRVTRPPAFIAASIVKLLGWRQRGVSSETAQGVKIELLHKALGGKGEERKHGGKARYGTVPGRRKTLSTHLSLSRESNSTLQNWNEAPPKQMIKDSEGRWWSRGGSGARSGSSSGGGRRGRSRVSLKRA